MRLGKRLLRRNASVTRIAPPPDVYFASCKEICISHRAMPPYNVPRQFIVHSFTMQNKITLAVLSAMFLASPMLASAASISSTLDIGSTGGDVSTLQTYLATDVALYPQGLVTGYYGALSAAAVQRFQCRANLV